MNAHDFYNLVVLMRANQKGYFRLKKKKDKTPEETEQCKKFFNNSVALEKRVDDEIKRVQTIMEERTQNE